MNKGNITVFFIQSLLFLLLRSLSTTLYVQGRSDATLGHLWCYCSIFLVFKIKKNFHPRLN